MQIPMKTQHEQVRHDVMSLYFGAN
jgi:hypothetical protein